MGKAYCDCMKKNGAPKDYLYSRVICDGKLIQKSRLYRIEHVELQSDKLHFKIQQNTLDSITIFNRGFYDYVTKNCCQLEINCNKDTTKKSN